MGNLKIFENEEFGHVRVKETEAKGKEVNITLSAREILEKIINQTAEQLPMSLKVNHVAVIMNCSKRQVYEMLADNNIPGAKKIKGLGWRIPRDPFLAWWYGKGVKN